MTAIAGVINKHGIAIAADSAVTFGNTHKVVNNGNKLFTLSKHAPVGIATYGKLSLMSTPWDIIIKQYRRKLGDTRYSHLNDYVSDFFKYLRTNLFFTDETIQHFYLKDYIGSFYKVVDEKARLRLQREPNIDYNIHFKNCLSEFVSLFGNPQIVCEDFKDYSYEFFMQFANPELNAVFNTISFTATSELFDLFSRSVYYSIINGDQIQNKEIVPSFLSGLVFLGYGEDEIYPSIVSKQISIVVEGRLKYFDGEGCTISDHGNTASVIPFAQVDVIQTVVRGINPSFYSILTNSFIKVLQDYSSLIVNTIEKNNPELIDLKNAISRLQLLPLANSFGNIASNEFQRLYTQPLMQTVINLDKEDMANMAESFVSLTSLIRRMSPGEETVGGPVDVAFVSKGDGFIWIKRKFYFKPELNYHFFENYFKS